jgi:hypothetical protein
MHSIEKYRAWLDSPDEHLRGAAVNIFLYSGQATSDDIEKIKVIAMQDGIVSIRRDCVRMIADMATPGDETNLALLIDRLTDEDWRIQGYAVRGICTIDEHLLKDPRIQPYVESANNPFVRFCANL